MALAPSLSAVVRSRLRPLFGNVFVLAALVVLASFTAYQSWLHYQHLAQVSLSNLSQALGNHIGSIIAKADVSLNTAADEMKAQLASGPIDAKVLNRVLARQKSLQPDLYALRATDSLGYIRFGTEVPEGRPISVADRDYFIRLRDNPQAGLVISAPYMGLVSKQWVVMVARRVDAPDGSFGGVVFAVITVDHLTEMMSSLNLGDNGVVALHKEDLRLIARFPEPNDSQAIGTRISTPAFEESLASSPESGTFIAVSPLDRLERTFAYRKVDGLPLYIVVGRATQDSLSAWSDEAVKLAGIVTAFGLLTLWLLRGAQQAAEQQQAARRLLQEAVDSIDAGFSIYDEEDRLIVCNEAYRRFHPASRHLISPGARFEEILRHKAASGHYPEAAADPERWVKERLQRHRSGNEAAFEQRIDDGRYILTVEHRTASGYAVSNQMDITELVLYREHLEKLVEARTRDLKEALGQFRILVEQAPTAIAMLDRNMTYLAASTRWVQEYGSSSSPLIGRNHYEAHPDLPVAWKEVHRAALAGLPQEKDEDCWVREDGTKVWLTWAVYPWRDEHGEIGGIIIAGDDITRRKQVEEEIRELNAELERRVEKRTAELTRSNEALLHSNMELQNFAHAAAHDLQTPLRSIAGFTQLLQRFIQQTGDEQALQWASLVVKNTKRLQILIQQLLGYTRLDSQGRRFKTVDLRDVMDEVVGSLRSLIQETGAEISADPLPTVSVDRIQIAQVFQNLVENGIKYNQSKPPRISISCKCENNEWLFAVTDNGIGIAPKYREKIFEIFCRLHTYHEISGSGIGLALCRRIVERHRGRIWVESHPGEGSIFYFTLPTD